MVVTASTEQLRGHLAAIIASSDDAIISKTLDGIITSWNQSAERLYGYTADEAIGQPITLIIPPDHPNELPAILERLRRGERFDHYETVRRHKDGHRMEVSVTISPILDGRGSIIGASAITRDIGERKRLERAMHYLLEASRLLAASLSYETTLQTLAQLVVPELADWCTIHLQEENGAVRQLAVAHVDPAKVAWAEALAERYPPALDAERGYPRVLRTGEPELLADISDELLVAASPDPEALALLRGLGLKSSICVPLRVEERTLGALTFVMAESARHYTTDDLALAEELARRAATAIEHARLYRAAQDALRLRDEFLGAISHDLRTPLATIRGMVQLGLRQANRLQTSEGTRISERLLTAEAASVKMAAMIDELLDLTRIESDQPLSLQREPTDLVALVEHLAREFQDDAPLHMIAVEAAAPDIIGEWDATRLERVLANLLSNAVKYSPQGDAIVVRVRLVNGERVPLAEVVIEDRGIGIPAADLPRIFERFHRGANVVGQIRGVGIGLAGAKQIVEQHGGTLAVQSVEGEGTTVLVRLPVRPDGTPSMKGEE